jgi:hypothetical protein
MRFRCEGLEIEIEIEGEGMDDATDAKDVTVGWNSL